MLPQQRNPCTDCKSPNTAQLGGIPYHSPKLHVGPCSSVGMRPGQTDRQAHTQTRVTTIHFASSTTHAKCKHVQCVGWMGRVLFALNAETASRSIFISYLSSLYAELLCQAAFSRQSDSFVVCYSAGPAWAVKRSHLSAANRPRPKWHCRVYDAVYTWHARSLYIQ